MRDAGARAIGDAGRDHTAIGMAEQHDVAQILEFEHAQHILDMRIEVDRGIGEWERSPRPV